MVLFQKLQTYCRDGDAFSTQNGKIEMGGNPNEQILLNTKYSNWYYVRIGFKLPLLNNSAGNMFLIHFAVFIKIIINFFTTFLESMQLFVFSNSWFIPSYLHEKGNKCVWENDLGFLINSSLNSIIQNSLLPLIFISMYSIEATFTLWDMKLPETKRKKELLRNSHDLFDEYVKAKSLIFWYY